jgi:hypothetical protein
MRPLSFFFAFFAAFFSFAVMAGNFLVSLLLFLSLLIALSWQMYGVDQHTQQIGSG